MAGIALQAAGATASAPMIYFIAILIGVVALAAFALFHTASRDQQEQEQSDLAGQDSLASCSRRSMSSSLYSRQASRNDDDELLDAIVPPAPRTRTSIDRLRRQHMSGRSSSSLLSSRSSQCGSGASSPLDSLDSMELDAALLSTFNSRQVNRVLDAVPAGVFSQQKALLELFDWDYNSLHLEECMLGAASMLTDDH
ncbi:hypothetical protein HYH03_005655 [Edaphochlamys debaryana]|uniref:Uncharacterized protein n=1 Tax=Edaphochlamys debaryana TaxID=47281 RepID=A0A835Y901_9CHLO|nr:hypothetical protein HYH03_005655 [Edaphochlamys debaryana]|eukprot:KAG2496431.1 hypothetical protein HYH03_005655 [Edaphochlamys debaryana]